MLKRKGQAVVVVITDDKKARVPVKAWIRWEGSTWAYGISKKELN